MCSYRHEIKLKRESRPVTTVYSVKTHQNTTLVAAGLSRDKRPATQSHRYE